MIFITFQESEVLPHLYKVVLISLHQKLRIW